MNARIMTINLIESGIGNKYLFELILAALFRWIGLKELETSLLGIHIQPGYLSLFTSSLGLCLEIFGLSLFSNGRIRS